MALCKAEETLSEALTGFDFGGQIVGAVRYGKGHINDTFCVYTQDEAGDCVRFILQRIKHQHLHRSGRPDGKHRGRDRLSARHHREKRWRHRP